MILSHQVQLSWIRTPQAQWLCPGVHHQMKRGTTDCTTWCPNGTPSKALGGRRLTTCLTTSSRWSTFCLGGSIISGCLLKTTWVFLRRLSLLHLEPKKKKVWIYPDTRLNRKNAVVTLLHLSISENFKVTMPEKKPVSFQSAPSFIVPLRRRTAPRGYECLMSCAVKGDPAPRVTWLHNSMGLNTNTNYHITNVCGVCSLLVLRVGARDSGEYKVVIENKLGSAECSMTLNVRGKHTNAFTRFPEETEAFEHFVSLQSEEELRLLWTEDKPGHLLCLCLSLF